MIIIASGQTPSQDNRRYKYIFLYIAPFMGLATYFKTLWGFIFLLLLLILINMQKLYSFFNKGANGSDQYEISDLDESLEREPSFIKGLFAIINEKNMMLSVLCIVFFLISVASKGSLNTRNTKTTRFVCGFCMGLMSFMYILLRIEFVKEPEKQYSNDRNRLEKPNDFNDRNRLEKPNGFNDFKKKQEFVPSESNFKLDSNRFGKLTRLQNELDNKNNKPKKQYTLSQLSLNNEEIEEVGEFFLRTGDKLTAEEVIYSDKSVNDSDSDLDNL